MTSVASLAKLWGITWLYWWQIPMLILLILLLVFWSMYRRKQY